jgi:hypothetical protein
MQAHEQRVVDERKELNKKFTDLCKFIDSSAVFLNLHINERARLNKQRGIMSQYIQVLDERIDAFGIIGDCGCRFENEDSNSIVLCEVCSELPCHNA